jgi:crotonobetainyl-CoA:carnitine CoA-transferase CaiB-like acyl-CoA transferase
MTTQESGKTGGADAGLAMFSRLRVVELGSWLAAPQASALFADLGAQVIKVEPPKGDPVRQFPGSMRGGESVPSAGFEMLNRDKQSVVIDIFSEEGKSKLDAFLATADVLVTNMRLSLLERADLAPQTLAAKYPRLVIGSLTGQGLLGPDRDLPGFDVGAFWARSGLLGQVTPEGSAPLALTGGYGDLLTGLAMFAAVAAGLLEREATGKGGVVETSLLQTGAYALSGDVVSQAAYGKAPRARPREQSRTPLVNCYRTADDRWFFLTAVEVGRHFEGVCKAIEREDLVADPRFADVRAIGKNAAELIGILDGEFAKLPLAEWAERFDGLGVWWEKVAKPAEVMDDPQIAANGMARQLRWGDGAMRAVVSPFKVFGHVPGHVSQAPELDSAKAESFG